MYCDQLKLYRHLVEQSFPIENWKSIIGFPDFIVSDLGRIFNLRLNQFVSYHIHSSRSGKYLRCVLDKKKFMVHVIVALHWCEQPDELHCEVDHKDRNKLNPAAYNLRWTTPINNRKLFKESNKIEFMGNIYLANKSRKAKNGKSKRIPRRKTEPMEIGITIN